MTPIDNAAELVAVSEELGVKFAKTAAAVDTAGDYPSDNLADLHDAGFSRLAVPRDLGGIAADQLYGDLPKVAEILTNIASGESSTAQIWMINYSVGSMLLRPSSPLSPEHRSELAQEVLRGARFCSAGAEHVKPRFSYRTTATPVEGGVILNGTKRFATGVKGATYAIVLLLHSDYESVEAGGLYNALVRLDAPGVRIIDDWDNMGQRATGSCSVELTDVFVPDGYHWAPGAKVAPHEDVSGPINQVMFASILLGLGTGALRAISDYLGHAPAPTVADNPYDLSVVGEWQIGQHYITLAGARALIQQAAAGITGFTPSTDDARARVSAAMMCAKVAATEASLEVCGDIHRMGGGRSTTREAGLDVFWRNARTLSTHDPQDVKKRHLGRWVLRGINPPVDALS